MRYGDGGTAVLEMDEVDGEETAVSGGAGGGYNPPRITRLVKSGSSGDGEKKSSPLQKPAQNVVVSGETTTKTGKTTTKSDENRDFQTTTRREYNWRIEINRRERKGDGYTYHWNYRMQTASGKRRAKYGGSLVILMARDPKRWERYLYNSRHNKRSQADGKEE